MGMKVKHIIRNKIKKLIGKMRTKNEKLNIGIM